MTSFTQVFGGETVSPTHLSLVEYTLSSDLTLYWPKDAASGQNLVGDKTYVTPTAGGFVITMPSAEQVSIGTDVLFENPSAYSFDVEDAAGGAIITVAAGTAWLVTVTDNSTAAGTWNSLQYGTVSSAADAASLAGQGLVALGSLLNSQLPTFTKNSAYGVGANDRATTLVSTGGVITFTFSTVAVLVDGWFCLVRNDGSGALTLDPSGTETIDGAATKTLNPGESCIVVSDGVELRTFGYGRSVSSSVSGLSVNIAGTGTTTLTSTNVLSQVQVFTGLLTGNRNVEYGTAVGYWFVFNNTTGAFTTTFKVNGADAGVAVAQGTYNVLRSDGTNMKAAITTTAGTVTSVATGTGLTGGPITSTGTINLANTTVVAGSYGSVIYSPIIDIDAQGRITNAANATIAPPWTNLTSVPDAISSVAALTPAADRLAYYTGAAAAALTPFTAFGRSLVDDADAAAGRVTLSAAALGANTFTGLQADKRGTDIASAATCDIWAAADGNVKHITGGTGISSFGTAPQAGASMWVVFDGVVAITHGANIDIPGGANRTTAAGDALLIYADTTTTMKVLVWTQDNGGVMVGDSGSGGAAGLAPAPAAGDAGKFLSGAATYKQPARVLLATKSPSGAAEVTFTANATGEFDATTYCAYEIEFTVLPATDGADLQCTFSTDGGSTWKTGATDYHWLSNYVSGAGGSVSSGNSAYIQVVDDIGNAAGRQVNGTIKLMSRGAGVRVTELMSNVVRKNTTGTTVMETTTGYYDNSTAVTGFRFAMSSGNMTGVFNFYGISQVT